MSLGPHQITFQKKPLVIFRCRWHYVYMFDQRETQLWRTPRSRRTQRNRMRRKWRHQMRYSVQHCVDMTYCFTSSVSCENSSNITELPVDPPTGHGRTRSNSVWGDVIHSQLHPAQQIHLFWQCQKYVFLNLNTGLRQKRFLQHRLLKHRQVDKSKSFLSCAMLPLVSFFTEKNKSYAISSFVETKGETMIAKTAVEFVEYPLRTLHMLSCSKK